MTSKNSRVGDQLKARRQELGYSLHKVEVATKIRGKYLSAIEANDFANLPNDVYSRGFVKQYAMFLGLPATEIVKRYQSERGDYKKTFKQVKPRALDFKPGATSSWVASLVVMGVLAVVIGYLIWQFSSLTSAPKLILDSPAQDQVVNDSSIEVKGVTAPGADVFLNDVPLPSDVEGRFKTTLILQPGINEVKIVSKNKLGKETRLSRNILSKQTAIKQLPDTTFDGVAVMFTASDALSVRIEVDGKTMYEGGMVKGSTRLMQAKDRVVVTASNPASIKALITNSVVVNYDFGTLGTSGDTRSVEFSKTTAPN